MIENADVGTVGGKGQPAVRMIYIPVVCQPFGLYRLGVSATGNAFESPCVSVRNKTVGIGIDVDVVTNR